MQIQMFSVWCLDEKRGVLWPIEAHELAADVTAVSVWSLDGKRDVLWPIEVTSSLLTSRRIAQQDQDDSFTSSCARRGRQQQHARMHAYVHESHTRMYPICPKHNLHMNYSLTRERAEGNGSGQ
jgi:hypothetical protein